MLPRWATAGGAFLIDVDIAVLELVVEADVVHPLKRLVVGRSDRSRASSTGLSFLAFGHWRLLGRIWLSETPLHHGSVAVAGAVECFIRVWPVKKIQCVAQNPLDLRLA